MELRRQARKRATEVQTRRLDMQVGADLLPVRPGQRGPRNVAGQPWASCSKLCLSTTVRVCTLQAWHGLQLVAPSWLYLHKHISVNISSSHCAWDACSPAPSGANSTESWRPSSCSWSSRACSARPPGAPDVGPSACGRLPSSVASPVSRSCGHPLPMPAQLLASPKAAYIHCEPESSRIALPVHV